MRAADKLRVEANTPGALAPNPQLDAAMAAFESHSFQGERVEAMTNQQ